MGIATWFSIWIVPLIISTIEPINGACNTSDHFDLNQSCRPGFIFLQDWNVCIQADTTKLAFHEAIKACRKYEGNLIKIDSEELEAKVTEHFEAGNLYWIGLIMWQGKSSTHHWISDDSIFDPESDYNRLDPSDLEDRHQAHCVLILWNTNRWFATSCIQRAGHVCASDPLSVPKRPHVYIAGRDPDEEITLVERGKYFVVKCEADLSTNGIMRFAVYEENLTIAEFIEVDDTKVSHKYEPVVEPDGRCGRSISAGLTLLGQMDLDKKRIACITYKIPHIRECSREDHHCSYTAKLQVIEPVEEEEAGFNWIYFLVAIVYTLMLMLFLLVLKKMVFKKPDEGEGEGKLWSTDPARLSGLGMIAGDVIDIQNDMDLAFSGSRPSAKSHISTASSVKSHKAM